MISLSKLSGETVLITKNNIPQSRSYRMCFVTGVVTADNLNRPKLIVSSAFVFLFNLDCWPTCCFRIARRFARLAYFQCVDFFKQFYYVGLISVDIRARQYIARIWYIQAYTVYIGIYRYTSIGLISYDISVGPRSYLRKMQLRQLRQLR